MGKYRREINGVEVLGAFDTTCFCIRRHESTASDTTLGAAPVTTPKLRKFGCIRNHEVSCTRNHDWGDAGSILGSASETTNRPALETTRGRPGLGDRGSRSTAPDTTMALGALRGEMPGFGSSGEPLGVRHVDSAGESWLTKAVSGRSAPRFSAFRVPPAPENTTSIPALFRAISAVAGLRR